jgi:hypothetical protein
VTLSSADITTALVAGFRLSRCSCGASPTRTLGSISYCDECAETVLEPIRRSIAERDGIGFGEQIGPLRPDWGRRWALLGCVQCDASWVGPIGESCWWCKRRQQLSARWRAEDEARAAFERRRVPGVLQCDECGQLFGDGELIEHSVCGVGGRASNCNGRLRGVYK